MPIGVIAEYNPFHSGHAYQLTEARKRYAGSDSRIIAVMSGAFVQRGEPALLDSYVRTRMALAGGASLVLQLPTYYSTATAEWFAYGAVKLLAASGLTDALSFGIEDPSTLPLLERAASLLSPRETASYKASLKLALAEGLPFAKARQKSLEMLIGHDLPADPNAILALEYLKALRHFPKFHPQILPIQRVGMGYHQMQGEKEEAYPSATYLRSLAQRGEDLLSYLPPDIGRTLPQDPNYIFPEALYPALSYRLSQMTEEELKDIDEVGEGLENRLLAAASLSCSYEDLLEHLKTKRYPTARMQRILLNIVLSITKDRKKSLLFSDGPAYIRVLGFRRQDMDLLSKLQQESTLPVLVNLTKDQKKLTGTAAQMFQDELRFYRYYQTLSGKPYESEFRQPLIIE